MPKSIRGLLVFRLINEISKNRFPWVFLILISIGLEACGIYFQYYLRFDPCVYCIYERVFILGFFFSGLIGALIPNLAVVRFLALCLSLASSIAGIITGIDHFKSVNSTGFGAACKLTVDFPEYLPLDSWMPWFFSPRGNCDKLPWDFLGLDIPSWIIIIFAIGVLGSVLGILSLLAKKKEPDYLKYYR